MTNTITYYNQKAAQFFSNTVHVDMSPLYERFLEVIPVGGTILDAGCGSGRDTKAFLDKGYRVSAFDASPEMAKLATDYTRLPVKVRTFAEVNEESCYDGIWACASLLHLREKDIPDALHRLWFALKPGGAFYFSFKIGVGEREVDGRHFTDVDEGRVRNWLRLLDDVDSTRMWMTNDQRPDRLDQWLNVIVRRRTASRDKLIAGGSDPFLPHLCAAISQSVEIDLAVAFIKTTGLRLLLPDLHNALVSRRGPLQAPARMRILTSDYLDVTDPEALRLLILLRDQGAQIKVYESAGGSFHLKAYMFVRHESEGKLQGTAFIGSSNVSRQALQGGLEWNYRIDHPGDNGFLEARNRFEELFSNPKSVALSDTWIERYESRRVLLPRAIAPGSQEQDPAPNPTSVQKHALAALDETRSEGYSRGLVVLATGLGKTWLSAFDAEQYGARRILFVAHREEILQQAAETFLRIRPHARVGFYMGQNRDVEVDVLCASIQTLSKNTHLERFSSDHFDYIVIDEFHHAAAATYRRLLGYFTPRFMLGLTATPDRTDQSDILSLCDDNLVFTCQLFDGIRSKLLAPFHYYGIYDDSIDYREIPWRNGRFDPTELSSKLATLSRARHALNEWRLKAQQRTLAFCVSVNHANFMAEHFRKAGVSAAAVYADSPLSRGEALEKLRERRLEVIFSVDLFNEGVDLPEIDTVMLLRPTESKILFLQQLGRGLRKTDAKEKLVVLDFVGNHHSFLHKPQALFEIGSSYRQLAEFARRVAEKRLDLPDGCFVNYDLKLIGFLKSLDSDGSENDYEALKQGLGRRPTLSEFYRSGSSLQSMRQQHGSWFELVNAKQDLDAEDAVIASAYRNFLQELEVTNMTRSFKMVLLEAFQELDGWRAPPLLSTLAQQSWKVMQRRRPLLADLPEGIKDLQSESSLEWQRYWRKNPVSAWLGENKEGGNSFFKLIDQRFCPAFAIPSDGYERFSAMVQELIDYRLAAYEVRIRQMDVPQNVIPFKRPSASRTDLPFFPNLRVACGHFKPGFADAEEFRSLSQRYGTLDPQCSFIARASGDSMKGGERPVNDGDYLLLEYRIANNDLGINGKVMVIEKRDAVSGQNQYLLRLITEASDGTYILKANNPAYADLRADKDMRMVAELKAVIDPLEFAIGEPIKREDIPALFGEVFNPGNWNSGHVVLQDGSVHVLLVTLNKQGKSENHRYLDHWIDKKTFHWQSQNSTSPASKRGREIIEQDKLGTTIHLFVREAKLAAGKGAPFVYQGAVRYRDHTGSNPMSVIFEVGE